MIHAHLINSVFLQMQLSPRQADWLKGMMQNVDHDTEQDPELNSFRIDLFNAIRGAQEGHPTHSGPGPMTPPGGPPPPAPPPPVLPPTP